MSNDYSAIWRAITDDTVPAGLVLRRVLPDSPYDVHLMQSRPERLRSLVATFTEPSGELWKRLTDTKGLEVQVTAPEPTRVTIRITQTDSRYDEVFDALINTILNGLDDLHQQSLSERQLALDFVCGRLIRWTTCFRSAPEGLGPERQVGLVGELHTLLGLLDAGVKDFRAVHSWQGPFGAPQDFQVEGSSLEVKASRQAQPVAVRITSERQLDTPAGENLALLHFSIDARTVGGGQTLPALIDQIRARFANGSEVLAAFDDALIAYGYLHAQAHRYGTSFEVRSVDCFAVTDEFPCIREGDLPSGIGEVSYALALSSCEQFRIEPNDAFKWFASTQL